MISRYDLTQNSVEQAGQKKNAVRNSFLNKVTTDRNMLSAILHRANFLIASQLKLLHRMLVPRPLNSKNSY